MISIWAQIQKFSAQVKANLSSVLKYVPLQTKKSTDI